MITYRARLKKGVKGVYGISLVDQPAMEGDFVQFSKQNEIKFAEVDKSKRRIMGLVLEPNKLVYRNQGGEEFNVVFEAQDVEDVAYNFQKQSNQSNSTIQHSGERIEGVTFVETWIIEDPKIDKSVKFGFEYPKGSWMAVMQIDNEDVWLNYVETGKVKGFSIDALMSFEEIKLNNQNQVNMEDDKSTMDTIKEQLSKLLSLISGKEQEEEPVEVPMAEEETDDDKKKRLEEEEKTKNLAMEAEKLALEKVETEKETAIKLAKEEVEKSIPAKIELAVAEAKKEFDTKLELAVSEAKKLLEDKNLELTKEIEVLTAKNLELGKQPATDSINKKKIVQIAYKDMTRVEQMRYNREKRG